MSEALIFASNNPQYDNKLSIELTVMYKKIPRGEHGENMGRTCCVHKLFWMSKQKTIFEHNMFSTCFELGIFTYWTDNSMINLLSYCGLVDAKIRASDIDLPVPIILVSRWTICGNTVVRKNAKSKYIKGK